MKYNTKTVTWGSPRNHYYSIYTKTYFMYLVKQNYTDTGDTNIHACDMNLRNLMCLGHDALIAIESFESNYSKFPLT